MAIFAKGGVIGVPDGGTRQVSLKRSRLHLRLPCPVPPRIGRSNWEPWSA